MQLTVYTLYFNRSENKKINTFRRVLFKPVQMRTVKTLTVFHLKADRKFITQSTLYHENKCSLNI